ncbi:hypothetical protein ACJZ2D_004405 [Fusarium nematophilum]
MNYIRIDDRINLDNKSNQYADYAAALAIDGNTPADKRNEILDKINNERNDCNKASNPQKCFDCVDDVGLVYIAAAAACFLTIELPWVTLACEGAAATVWNQAIGNCVRGD